jgi:hypothetical protein
MTDATTPPPGAGDPPPPPPPPPAPPPTPSVPSAGGYPVTLELTSPLGVARWRPLVNWLLAIPQWIVLYFLQIAAGVLWIVSFFTILFTKRNPFVGFQAMVLRYNWRVTSYVLFMREDYPPFEFETTVHDPTDDPASVSVRDPGEMNRWLVLVKWLLAIPHFIVLAFLGIAVAVVWLIAFFAVIFTGGWPEGMRKFVVGFMRWATRVNGYVLFLTDEYPPFSLE